MGRCGMMLRCHLEFRSICAFCRLPPCPAHPLSPPLFPLRRLAGILRQLSAYYYKEPTLLFLVRIAQGLAHMGKGLLTLSPYHSDHVLLSGEGPLGLLRCAVLRCFGQATRSGRLAFLCSP